MTITRWGFRKLQNIIQYYVEAKGVVAVTLKLFDAYGPNDPRTKLMNLLFQASQADEFVPMIEGQQKIDLIHVNDVSSAYLAASERLISGSVNESEVFGVGSSVRFSLKEMVDMFERVSGKHLNIGWGLRAYREREVMDPCRLTMLSGWLPFMDLEQGIASIR